MHKNCAPLQATPLNRLVLIACVSRKSMIVPKASNDWGIDKAEALFGNEAGLNVR